MTTNYLTGAQILKQNENNISKLRTKILSVVFATLLLD